MTKINLGAKRLCPGCGARFYDLGHNPAKCPKCGIMHDATVAVKARRSRSKAADTEGDAPKIVAKAEKPKPKVKKPIKEIEDVSLEEFEELEPIDAEEEIEEIEEIEDIDSLEELEEIEESGQEDESGEDILIEGDDADDSALIDAVDDEEEEEAEEPAPAASAKPKPAKPKNKGRK